MELLIVIIAVVLVAVIALGVPGTKAKYQRSSEQTPSTQESTPVEEAYIPEELEEYSHANWNAMDKLIKAIQNYVTQQEWAWVVVKQFVDDLI